MIIQKMLCNTKKKKKKDCVRVIEQNIQHTQSSHALGKLNIVCKGLIPSCAFNKGHKKNITFTIP